jgi:hypothetical protein
MVAQAGQMSKRKMSEIRHDPLTFPALRSCNRVHYWSSRPSDNLRIRDIVEKYAKTIAAAQVHAPCRTIARQTIATPAPNSKMKCLNPIPSIRTRTDLICIILFAPHTWTKVATTKMSPGRSKFFNCRVQPVLVT